MVKVWYEPPPGGPRSNLNRGAYYIDSAMTPTFIKKLSKSPPAPIIMGFIGVTAFLCYLPLMSPKNLPSTLSAEHLAAQRAYMRYHNMNPIFGTSSKQARAADPDP
mmetsp:Transcript_48741/g.74159  ORF Transcript_48741/g.74159 Transcript_48741/m.74159 type:complete len:106 (-) Transcript_48741:156-473(-)|eukprot:CAMPEP_0117045588 /NCGR_PEP_ID=MMETSP0472-20121206/31540_1 /TAXON_ID=693140 ORGANISM="Tiarina fusus, Strain LIS" /NCGR_SAMPLE_ID=MMETSP0472 /ASSEMBLY_ACC=CAM_ASM_000603 /LENGTH=105 /DNA_ID=CAMNT_0004757651 /DNA_START=32 /DNA_END=349 /DNA_ORIENTATION=+